jgi:hypothetical protein
MLKDLLTKVRRRALLGCVALALLASGLGYTFGSLKAALDERATLAESLDRVERAGLAGRQERLTLDTLGDVLERSSARITLLTKAGTRASAAPLPDEERAQWTRAIDEERAQVRNDQGLLGQLAQVTTGPLGRMVELLRQQVAEEDHAWDVVARSLAAHPENTSAVREDEFLRELAASLMKIGQWVSAYQEGLREANRRLAHEDDARLGALLARTERLNRSIARCLVLSIGALLLLAAVLAAMIASSRARGKRLPRDVQVRV